MFLSCTIFSTWKFHWRRWWRLLSDFPAFWCKNGSRQHHHQHQQTTELNCGFFFFWKLKPQTVYLFCTTTTKTTFIHVIVFQQSPLRVFFLSFFQWYLSAFSITLDDDAHIIVFYSVSCVCEEQIARATKAFSALPKSFKTSAVWSIIHTFLLMSCT